MASTNKVEAAAADTGQRLLQAAVKEFRRAGFGGTDTNRIARRAGFAPQTFYRWFDDKTEIFLAAYRAWEEEEQNALAALIGEKAAPERLVATVIAHHRAHLQFRRSLRQLSVEEPRVRRARAESRARQIERIRAWNEQPASRKGAIGALLLQLERLADAIAEGEFQDLGVPAAEAERAMADLIRRLQG